MHSIEINWNPIAHVGPIPINWYGLTVALGFIVGWRLVRRWAPQFDIAHEKIDGLLIWIIIGTVLGARLYYVAQNDPGSYLRQPWRIAAIWEGGLAYFGGLFGAILAAFIHTKREKLSFARVADLFAPAIPIGSAIGRTTCGLAGMDYGTPTTVPWGVVYTNANSYAPIDGVPRHPDQFYELLGDLVIAVVLIKLRGRFANGKLFLAYLILFSILRFFIFFVRGSVPTIALGLKNAQWTALAIVFVAGPVLVVRMARDRKATPQ